MNKMEKAFQKTLEVLTSSVPGLLGEGTVESQRTSEWSPAGEVVLGSVGFGGSTMRGSLVLIAAPASWKSVAPQGLTEHGMTNALLCDMVAEECNMLVGRLKNKLLRRGIEIVYGIPTSAYGHLTFPPLPVASTLHVSVHELVLPRGKVYLRTEVLFGDEFEFPVDDDVVGAIEPLQSDLFF